MTRVPHTLRAAALLALAGCGWVPATIGAIAGTKSRHDDPAPPPAPPAFVERPYAGVLPLDDEPIDVAVGDFLRNAAGEDEAAADVAVLFENGVRWYRGDGTGRLVPQEQLNTPLHADRAVTMLAAAPASDGAPAALLVVTTRTLERIRHTGTKPEVAFAPLGGIEDTRRDVAVGDFDGDGALEAAVSSYANRWVEFFEIDADVRPYDVFALDVPPVSIAGTAFLHPGGRADLTVLTERGGWSYVQIHCPRDDGSFCREPDATLPLPKPTKFLVKDAFRLNKDSLVDLAYARIDGTGSVFVKPPAAPAAPFAGCGQFTTPGGPAFTLDLDNKGGGHHSPDPAGMLIMDLPGGNERTAKTGHRVTIDRTLQAIVCSYFRTGGKDIEKTISYPLPGPGIALAKGDLDGNGYEDLVAAAGEGSRCVLVALLANAPGDEPGGAAAALRMPFFYPFGTLAGESLRSVTQLMDVAFGYAATEDGAEAPFLAAIDRTNAELRVYFLAAGDGAVLITREERYAGLDTRPAGVHARNFDLANGDDIVVVATDGYYLLRNKAPGVPGDRFTPDPKQTFESLQASDPCMAAEAAQHPEYLADYKLREHFAAGPIDAVEGSDLAIPVATAHKAFNYVLVVYNPGLPDERRVRFLKTLVDTRKVVIAKLNDDASPDLIVPSDSMKVGHLIYGDAAPGDFIEEDPTVWNMTESERVELLVANGTALRGLEAARGLSEATTASNREYLMAQGISYDDFAAWPVDQWILTSNTPETVLYCRTETGRYVQADIPYSGYDPEAIFIFDFYGNGRPDFVITEEWGGRIVFMESKGAAAGACEIWTKQDVPSVASPQHFAPFFLGDDLFLAVAGRGSQSVEVFKRATLVPGDETSRLNFTVSTSIPLSPENVQGTRMSFAAAPAADGRLVTATLVPDSRANWRKFSVDLAVFPVDAAALVDLGGMTNPARAVRVDLAIEALPEAILLADADGDAVPDLLAVDPADNCLYAHRGALDTAEFTVAPARAGAALLCIDDGPITAAHVVTPAGGPPMLAIATPTSVSLYAPSAPGAFERRWRSKHSYTNIVAVTPGWLGSRRDPNQDLFIAIAEPRRLGIEVTSDAPAPDALTSADSIALACVGAEDLNGDGIQDLAVVDAGALELKIILGRAGPAGAAFPAGSWRAFGYTRFASPVELGFLDSNGDGWTDVCFATKDGDVLIFQGNAHGDFAAPGVMRPAPAIEALRTADLDGDGSLDDIVLATSIPGMIVLPGKESSQ